MSIEKINQIIKFLLERSLLDSILFMSDTIMTGKSIQLRYQEGCANRKRDIEVEEKFWVLNENETKSFIKVRKNSDNTGINQVNPVINSINPVNNPTKKSKENKSKLYESKSAFADALTPEQKQSLIADYGDTTVNAAIDKWLRWISEHKIKNANAFKGISKILSEDFKKNNQGDDSSFNIGEIEKAVMEKMKKYEKT